MPCHQDLEVAQVATDNRYQLLPEWWELWEADGLDMDFPLSVEPRSSVPQPNGTDLTQSHRVSQHGAVQGATCPSDRQEGFMLINIYSNY